MKLGPLKAAIRDGDAPKVLVRHVLSDGTEVHINWAGQKTPLLAELDRLFPEGRGQETGLALTPEGFLTHVDHDQA